MSKAGSSCWLRGFDTFLSECARSLSKVYRRLEKNLWYWIVSKQPTDPPVRRESKTAKTAGSQSGKHRIKNTVVDLFQIVWAG